MIEKHIWSPNYSQRPNGLADVWGVILHHTASKDGSAVAIAKMFQNPSFEVAAHVVIDDAVKLADVVVVHCVRPQHAAWQAGKCRRYDWDRDGLLENWEQYVNTHTLGIEFVNKGDGRDSFHDGQIKAAARIIRRWDALCPNLKLRDITDHQTVNLNGKIDMRPNFPAAKLFWWIIHPYMQPPGNVYGALPKWAQRQVDEIKQD